MVYAFFLCYNPNMKIKLTAWTNGGWKTGKGTFGLSMRADVRDESFSKEWLEVVVELPNPDGGFSSIKIELYRQDGKPTAFWRDCPELRHEKIREWMIERGDIEPFGRPWPINQPPKYEAELTGNHLRVIRQTR